MIEFKVLTKDLVKSLALALSIVEKKNIIPILSNVKLKSENNILHLTATDGDLLLKQKIGVRSISIGAITVNLLMFNNIMRKISDSEIHIKYEANSLLIAGENCSFNLSVIEANQFPEIQEVETNLTCKLQAKELKRLIKYTEFSVSTEEMKYNLSGIFFHTAKSESMTNFDGLTEKKLYSAATDGHRLSTTAIDLECNEEFEFILPKKAVVELNKMIGDHDSTDVEIHISKNAVQFNIPNIVFISKLIDSTFPPYRRLIPENHPYQLIVDIPTLLAAIDRISIISSDKFRAIKMTISETMVEISSAYDSQGFGKEWMNFGVLCEYKGNSPFTIGFNPKYMMDVLAAIGAGKVILSIVDSVSSILITNLGDTHSAFIVMPVKVT